MAGKADLRTRSASPIGPARREPNRATQTDPQPANIGRSRSHTHCETFNCVLPRTLAAKPGYFR